MFDDNTTLHLPLERLRTFVLAAELGSFTRAGQEVYRSQSAVSMQIKRLEQDLGQQLFQRNARTVQLTEQGEVLLGYARQMLSLHDQALASMRPGQVSGMVRLGMPDDYYSRYLPGVLTRFARTHPLVRVDVVSHTSDVLLEEYGRGRMDVCLLTGGGDMPLPQGAEELDRSRLVWIRARGMETPDLTKGNGLPLALFHEGCLHRRLALEALAREGIRYRIAFSSSSLAGVLMTVSSGLAVSAVARASLDRSVSVIGAAEGLPELPHVSVLLMGPRDAENPAACCLAEFVRDSVGRQAIHGPRDAPAVDISSALT